MGATELEPDCACTIRSVLRGRPRDSDGDLCAIIFMWRRRLYMLLAEQLGSRPELTSYSNEIQMTVMS